MGRTWQEHVLHMFCPCSAHVLRLFSCAELVRNSMNNLLSYCGLIDAKIRTSDKNLPVIGDGSTTAGCVAKGEEPKMEAPVD